MSVFRLMEFLRAIGAELEMFAAFDDYRQDLLDPKSFTWWADL